MSVLTADAYMIQGDRGPELDMVLRDKNGDPIDLSAAQSIMFQAKHTKHTDRIVGAVTALEPFVVDGVPTGKAKYFWNEGDTAKPGVYQFNVTVVAQDGTPFTCPNYTYKTLEIRPKLGV